MEQATRRIVITDNFPAFFRGTTDADVGDLRPFGDVVMYDTPPSDAEEVARRLSGADALIFLRRHWKLDGDVLARAPRLRVVSFPGVNPDHIDLRAAASRGVLVCNVPGANAISVAEHALALTFAVARLLPLADRDLRNGEWRKRNGVELYGKTLGVLGLGAVGSHMARLGSGVGMRVVAWSFRDDPERAARLGVRLVPRDELFETSDVVSIHLRATPESQHMVGRRALARMKPGAILVNTARGALVDEEALVEALESGHLAGAGLDVFAQEPLRRGASRLIELDNVVATPHMADETREADARLRHEVVANVIAFFQGQPRNVLGR